MLFLLCDLFYASSIILISHSFVFLFDRYILKYVIFPKVLLLMLVHKTHTKCLIYLRQKPTSSRKSFKGVIITNINPLPFRTLLAK